MVYVEPGGGESEAETVPDFLAFRSNQNCIGRLFERKPVLFTKGSRVSKVRIDLESLEIGIEFLQVLNNLLFERITHPKTIRRKLPLHDDGRLTTDDFPSRRLLR